MHYYRHITIVRRTYLYCPTLPFLTNHHVCLTLKSESKGGKIVNCSSKHFNSNTRLIWQCSYREEEWKGKRRTSPQLTLLHENRQKGSYACEHNLCTRTSNEDDPMMNTFESGTCILASFPFSTLTISIYIMYVYIYKKNCTLKWKALDVPSHSLLLIRLGFLLVLQQVCNNDLIGHIT